MLWWLLLGIATGMRTMTAMAVLCWFAYLKLLPESGWAVWAGTLASAIVFSALALGEDIADALPGTPSRVTPGPLGARLVFGVLVGALAAQAVIEPLAGGVIFGLVGALIGAYGGFRLRAAAARRIGRDLPIALCESLLALLIAFWAAQSLYGQALYALGMMVQVFR